MDLKRFWRHVTMSPLAAARIFPSRSLDAIQAEVSAQEKRHRGEILCVIEAELTSGQLWHDLSSRERAKELFAARGVWNTEENNGVLIYVLLAERRVEIVADRGIHARATDEHWREICRMMEKHFSDGRYEEGAIAGVRAVSDLLAASFPATGQPRNELPDRPALI